MITHFAITVLALLLLLQVSAAKRLYREKYAVARIQD